MGVSCPYLFSYTSCTGQNLLHFHIPLYVSFIVTYLKISAVNTKLQCPYGIRPPHPYTQCFYTTFLECNNFPTLLNKVVRNSVPKTLALCAPSPCPTALYTVKHDGFHVLLADGFKLLPCACSLSTAPFPYFDNSHCFVCAKRDKILQYKIHVQLFRAILRFCL